VTGESDACAAASAVAFVCVLRRRDPLHVGDGVLASAAVALQNGERFVQLGVGWARRELAASGAPGREDDVAVFLDVTPRHSGSLTRLLVPLSPPLARAVVVAAAVAASMAPLAVPLAVPVSRQHGNALVFTPAQLGSLAAGVSLLRRSLGQAHESVEALHLRALESLADGDAAAAAAAAELRRMMRE
jgi:hypothetical protein